ncbi:hypothetical protein GRJ2_000136400 [Grus japonensis]|uniref:Mitochondria-eating protein C-terminal domain-containing protein n=1 Tax=Grus japonensis TaxID=30415 RepID=A0ABC9VW17_GRUJA
MDTPEFSSCGRTELFGGQSKGAITSKMTAGGRKIFDIPQQPSACTDQNLQLGGAYHDLIERLAKVEQEIREKRVWVNSADLRLQNLESCQRELLGDVTQKELQKKEEYKKLKEKNKELEARNKELLSKAMSMHKQSEDMNDPLRLTAVLEMYEMLRLREWEKFRSSSLSSLSYKAGSSIIKKVFDACEKDIQQRTTKIFEVLDITPLNDAMTNSKQGIMKEIRNLFRYSCSNNQSEFYMKIIMKLGSDIKTPMERQFALRCCQIYCLLLLQDPPVEAVWNLEESSMQYLEHVDRKDWEHCSKPVFLWPILKQGEQVILKGVIWDEK